MMQETIVALIVLCAAAAVLRRYAPRFVKRAARSWSARLAGQFGWHALAAKIAENADDGASCGNGCGNCGSCGTDPANPVEQNTISAEALKRTIPR